ncbi:interferon-related developmental regulator-domain-containing protein [Hypomontagnella submonticulosa]|nr:interferon-related developmental regulator-domain-containing protein [Hypomontagnella submonticulosa]
MHDLRKKIFESGKTVSRKARSRQQSAQASPASSRAGSRAASQHASEEEDFSDYEYEESLTSSIVNSEDGEELEPVALSETLHSRIVELLDQKRDSGQDRENKLIAYTELIRHHSSADETEELEGQLNDIIPLLMKTIQGRRTPQGVIWALKALTITILSTGAESIHDRVYSTLKGLCQDTDYDDDDESIKIEIIKAMCMSTMCGGGSAESAEEFLEFLIEIIESDGHIIQAGDNGPVVTTALEAWGFVASGLEDLEEQSAQALEAFIEQLESSDVGVQVAAGSNLALLLEIAREYTRETGETWNMRYDKDALLGRVNALTKESSKSISKRDRKQLHYTFNSIMTSLERGTGPGYSTARRLDNYEEEYGYRQKYRIQNISIVIDSWSLSAQIGMLKSILGGGLASHYLNNPLVKDMLNGAKTEYLSTPPNDRIEKRQSKSQKAGRGRKLMKEVSD